MHQPVHSWVQVPFTPVSKKDPATFTRRESYHRSFCLEYPPTILSGDFRAPNPACHSRDAAVTGPTALLLHIPGNPGCCQFYDRFASELLGMIPGLCLLVPSLAGFSIVTDPEHHHHKHQSHYPDQHRRLRLSGSRHLFSSPEKKSGGDDAASVASPSPNKKRDHHQEEGGPYLLEDQKLFLYSFVQSFVVPIVHRFHIPPERVFCSGHSIGGYFAMWVLDHFKPRNLFHRAVLLAPTIAQMASSINGVNMRNLLHLGKFFLPGLVNLVVKTVVPSKLLHVFVDMVMGHELHACHIHTVRCLLHAPDVTTQALSLGSDEVANVNPIPVHLMKGIESKLIFYFAKHDKWVPDGLRDEIKLAFPNLDGFHIETDETVTHAWCSRAHHQVAAFVAAQFHRVDSGVEVVDGETEFAVSPTTATPQKKKKKSGGGRSSSVASKQPAAASSGRRRQRGE